MGKRRGDKQIQGHMKSMKTQASMKTNKSVDHFNKNNKNHNKTKISGNRRNVVPRDPGSQQVQ